MKSNAFWVRTESDAATGRHGNLGAAQADVTRPRLRVETSRRFALGTGAFTLALELGPRHDGGDAETGAGVEAGESARHESERLSIKGGVRTLVAHADGKYREWGASGSVRLLPGADGRGLSLSLSRSWGIAGSGTEQLWGVADAQKLVGEDGGSGAGRHLSTEIGYGLGLAAMPGTLTPFAGMTLGDGGGQAWRTGGRWQIVGESNLSLGVTRTESPNGSNTDNAMKLQGKLR